MKPFSDQKTFLSLLYENDCFDVDLPPPTPVSCLTGEGQLIALELVSESGREEPPVIGEPHDLTAEHFVRFSPCNPHSVQQKKLIVRNNV